MDTTFLYGPIEHDVPIEIAPPEMWPEYGFVAGPPGMCRREEVGESPKGIRWSLWPLTFEYYVSDDEPNLEKSKEGRLALNRFVTWRRVHRTNAPQEWRVSRQNPSQIDGFRLLNQDITEGWHKNARRDLRLWQVEHDGKTHVIEKIALDEYERAYNQSLIAKRVDGDRVKVLKRKMMLPRVIANTTLWGVRDLASKKIVAGTAIIHSPTFKGSTHFAPFIHAEARRVYAATALMHHWFSEAQRRGDRFVTTTNFWIPGKPKGWKGFSEFKSHFGWRYAAYPPELTRFVRGKLF